MTVRIGVVVFPGSNCDRDTLRGLELAGAEAVPLWHEQGTLDAVAAVVLPGGFAYGDYLRAGVIARFSPVMRAVAAFAADGGLVLGICSGRRSPTRLVNGVSSRSATIRTSRPRKRRPRLRRSAPGTSPASAMTWKPLQIPRTRPPSAANAEMARITGLNRAITPARR